MKHRSRSSIASFSNFERALVEEIRAAQAQTPAIPPAQLHACATFAYLTAQRLFGFRPVERRSEDLRTLFAELTLEAAVPESTEERKTNNAALADGNPALSFFHRLP